MSVGLQYLTVSDVDYPQHLVHRIGQDALARLVRAVAPRYPHHVTQRGVHLVLSSVPGIGEGIENG